MNSEEFMNKVCSCITMNVDTEGLKKLEEYITNLQQENQQLKEQLNYLRSGEYYNQLRFERDMLQDLVDNEKISEEDKEFIDMTHRNTELLERLQQRDEVIDEAIKVLEKGIKFCKNDSQGAYDICNIAIRREQQILDILNKYKGVDD